MKYSWMKAIHSPIQTSTQNVAHFIGLSIAVDCVLNVIAHAQKPDFVFRRNGRVHLNRRGRQFSRLMASEVCASALIVGSNAGYTMFRGSVEGIGYPLHSPISPSLPLPCAATVCHHISAGLYRYTSTYFSHDASLCLGGSRQTKQCKLTTNQRKYS